VTSASVPTSHSARERRPGSPVLGLAAGLALGVSVGFASQAGHHLPGDAYWLASLGGPWLVAAFVAGALARRTAWGAVAGAATIVVGTLTYYWTVVIYHGLMLSPIAPGRERYGVVMTIGWSVAGTAVGAAFGYAGALWRRGGASLATAAGAAALAGALVGEALLLGAVWDDAWPRRVLTLELAAGVVAALALPRRRHVAALALALAATGVFIVAEAFVRHTLRAAGWAGV
jgi:uncharacterized protein DUF6518